MFSSVPHQSRVAISCSLTKSLLPATNTTFSFKSLLGYAASDEIAHAQVSVDGGANWQDLFVEAGSGGSGESTFTAHSYSLSNYVGQLTLLRFNYSLPTTTYTYYPTADNFVGWCLENIVVTNVLQAVGMVTNATASTNFTFTPTQAGTNVLAAAPVLFTQFPLGWGPFKLVNAITNPTPVIVLAQPFLTNKQVLLNFTEQRQPGQHVPPAANDELDGAVDHELDRDIHHQPPGSSYRFTATNNSSLRFYRVQTP